jgi:methyl-accepting chemotaxis protein
VILLAAVIYFLRYLATRDTRFSEIASAFQAEARKIADDNREHLRAQADSFSGAIRASQDAFQGQLDRLAGQFDRRLEAFQAQNQTLHADHMAVTTKAVAAITSLDAKGQLQERLVGEVVGQVKAVGEQVQEVGRKVEKLDERMGKVETAVGVKG